RCSSPLTAGVLSCAPPTSMEKDFDRWNRHKKKINDAADRPFYHAREIWWCAVGIIAREHLDCGILYPSHVLSPQVDRSSANDGFCAALLFDKVQHYFPAQSDYPQPIPHHLRQSDKEQRVLPDRAILLLLAVG